MKRPNPLTVMLVASWLLRGQIPLIPAPQFLNESAKQEFDRAGIVVLAKVRNASDRAERADTKYRLIEVGLDVQRVIKGSLASRTPCVVYYAPRGAFTGQMPTWVAPGSTGFFFLADSKPCLRAVNDFRAYIRETGTPDPRAVATSPEKLIAQSTLPEGCAGNDYLYRAGEDVWSITIPLVGSRAARKLLIGSDSNGKRSVNPCSCLAAASIWKLSEECLSSLPSGNGIREQARQIVNTNNAFNRQDLQQIRENPGAWLETNVQGWGMDGTTLRLAGVMSHSASKISQTACAALRARLRSPSLQTSLKSSQNGSNRAVEHAAVAQFGRWTAAGCRPTWAALENPVTDP